MVLQALDNLRLAVLARILPRLEVVVCLEEPVPILAVALALRLVSVSELMGHTLDCLFFFFRCRWCIQVEHTILTDDSA